MPTQNIITIFLDLTKLISTTWDLVKNVKKVRKHSTLNIHKLYR